MKTVKINGKNYPIKPGLNATRLFCKKMGWELHQFEANLQNMLPDGTTIGLEQIETIALYILSCIDAGMRAEKRASEFDLEIDDIIETIGDHPETLETFFGEFAESLPTEKDSKKLSAEDKDTEKN